MRLIHYILYLYLFYAIIPKTDETVLDFLKKLFIPQRHTNSSTNGTNSSDSINIVIVKRDVTSTIEKRSLKGIQLFKKINTTSDLHPCSDDQLMVYLAEIQAINPESIINLSTFDEIFIICRQISDSLDKMDAFLKTCAILNDKNLYIQLIKGVDKLYDTLCDVDSHIKREYFPCLKTLHEDFETCYGPPDWTEDACKKEICRAYKDIADCYYIKSAQVCGKKAARAMKSVVRAVVESVISVHCSNVVFNPLVKDAMPENGKTKQEINNYIMVTLFTVLYSIN